MGDRRGGGGRQKVTREGEVVVVVGGIEIGYVIK